MNSLKNTFRIFACLIILVTVTGCHPSATEKQDILDGMAFAQDNLPITGNMDETVLNFTNSGEFIRRSKYFKAGADYRALEIMVQILENVKSSNARTAADAANTTLDDSTRAQIAKDTADGSKDITNLCDLTWTSFNSDLRDISMTPTAFAKVVGSGDLPALMASNPYKDSSGSQ